MKLFKISFSIILLIFAFSQLSIADSWDAKKLYAGWREYKKSEAYEKHDFQKVMVFITMIKWVVDTKNGNSFDVPSHLVPRDYCPVVGRWLEQHPEKIKEPSAESLVVKALSEEYPIKR